MIKSPIRLSDTSILIRTLVPGAVSIGLWLTRVNEVNLIQLVCSFVILSLAVWMYSGRTLNKSVAIPVVSLIAGMYWWYFGFELFWGNREIGTWRDGYVPVNNEAITATMVGLVVGVIAMLLGAQTSLGLSLKWAKQWDIPKDSTKWTWLRLVLVLGLIGSAGEIPLVVFGQGGRQTVVLFLTIVPNVAFAILFRNYLRGYAKNSDKFLLLGFVVLRFVIGMASGWLGSAASLGVVTATVFLSERKTVPYWMPMLLLIYVLFFQVGKEQYRKKFWLDEHTASTNPVARLTYWFDASLEEWNKAYAEGDREAYVSLLTQSLRRTSLLTQVGNVIQKTPQEVPFQKGKTYSYFLVTWIPRFLWPGKPTVSSANQYYQVAYGLTPEDSLDRVSIAVGIVGEAYMNFGWVGIPAVMFCLGIALSIYQRLFLHPSSGCFLLGIGFALIPQLLVIESQLAQYLSGVVQQVLFCTVVFSPLLRRRPNRQSLVQSQKRTQPQIPLKAVDLESLA